MKRDRREPLPPDRRWRCQFCSAEQWQEAVVYAVPLCRACLYRAAADPMKGYHLQARLYVTEQERDTWRNTAEARSQTIASLMEEIARLQARVNEENHS